MGYREPIASAILAVVGTSIAGFKSRCPMLAVPTYDKLMWPTLRALKAMGGSATNEELLSKIIEIEEVPAEVQSVPHTQRETKLSYNLAWARTYLKKVGRLITAAAASGPLAKKAKA
jgi:Mrr restriction endonuclease-like protein